ncbi:TMPIT-domain-containing protein [Rhizoclosmatium globosum]|uniref:TMPIT-domain-containing protein n=1 Tax=Rhizoclosmatium globosum TaxID=329046 RepID=A0A1Y2BZP4_9FUNG|nr:TMPIT-domain-containing protein [Rhizoclosmatium globosum]|eukprot:ORY39535.1 TMPIT-domain-containing protein [Rhizoclosmatium globosum]
MGQPPVPTATSSTTPTTTTTTTTTTTDNEPTSAPLNCLQTGEALLSKLRELETRATEYNSLAQKVYAEEQSCVKELAAHRSLVAAFLAKSKAELKLLRAQSAASDAPLVQEPKDDDSDDDDEGPVLRNKVTPIPSIGSFHQRRRSRGDSIAQLSGPGSGWTEADDLENVVAQIQRKVSRIDSLLPRNAKFILKLALGSLAPFTLRPLQHRIQYKKQVESFKLRYTLLLIPLISISLLLPPSSPYSPIADSLFLFASLYYYSTLTLREHILSVNGSRITPWWFWHHYLCIGMTGVLLITPQSLSVTYPQFRTQFLLFCAYLGGVQYLQYRYQRERLYVLVSLDRAERMDLVAGDGVFGAPGGVDGKGLWGHVLLPFLVVGQSWQLWNAWRCFELFRQVVESGGDIGKEWHIFAVGILFLVLGFGNMITTFWSFFFSKKEPKGKRAGDSPAVSRTGSGLVDSLSSASLSRMTGSLSRSSGNLKAVHGEAGDLLRKRK